jgi:Domain of unknown function (DUF4260)
MTALPTTAVHPRLRTVAYAVLGVLLLSALVRESITHGIDLWQIGAFTVAPDLALFYGMGHGLAKGQLHRRAVPLYNAAHRFWGPLGLAVLVGVGAVPHRFLVGALAWAVHVALDRTAGYGLRDRVGFQRA